MWNRHRESEITKNFTTSLFRHETFYYLWVKGYSTWRERETQSFYADSFYIVSSQPNQRAAPVAHKFVWPRPALNVDSLVRRQELNSLLFFKSQPMLPVHDVIHIPWPQFLSGIFILTSLNDISSPCACEHLCSCLHLTNPCTEPKGSHPN